MDVVLLSPQASQASREERVVRDALAAVSQTAEIIAT